MPSTLDPDLCEFARQHLPHLPVPEVLAELSAFEPAPSLGNAVFRRHVQYVIVQVAGDEHADLARVRQLVALAQHNYRDVYLIASQELHAVSGT
jgi:hypothetical protein